MFVLIVYISFYTKLLLTPFTVLPLSAKNINALPIYLTKTIRHSFWYSYKRFSVKLLQAEQIFSFPSLPLALYWISRFPWIRQFLLPSPFLVHPFFPYFFSSPF